MAGPRLKESDESVGRERLEFALTDEDERVMFMPAEELEYQAAEHGLEPAEDRVPQTERELQSRIDEEQYHCEVTHTYEKSGLIRSKEVAVTHTYHLGVLADALDYLDGAEDLIAEAEFWVPTTQRFPMLVIFPRAPPEMASLVEDGEIKGPDEVPDYACEMKSGLMIPSSGVERS